jgi:hypothetical protein
MYMYLFLRVLINAAELKGAYKEAKSCREPTQHGVLPYQAGGAMICTAMGGLCRLPCLTLTRSCSAACFWHSQLLLLLLVYNITKCTPKPHIIVKSHKEGRRGKLPGCRHCGLVYSTWIYSYLSAEAGVLVRKLSQLTPGISLCSLESAVR